MSFTLHKKTQAGFSLVELAITMVIIGLLLGSIVIPISDTFQFTQVKSNAEKLKTAKESIIGFTIANGRLPCPAESWESGVEMTNCNNSSNSTIYPRDGSTNEIKSGVITGMLPHKSLSIFPREDVYGNPIFYTVERRLTVNEDTHNKNSNSSSFRNIALNNINLTSIEVKGRSEATLDELSYGNNVAFVLLSLGKKNNAISPTSSNNTYVTSTIPQGDERVNATNCCKTIPYDNSKSSVIYFSRNYNENIEAKNSSNVPVGAFDDQLIWAPWYQLIGIMTQANRLQ